MTNLALVRDDWHIDTKDASEFIDAITDLTQAGSWLTGIVSKDLSMEAIDGPIVTNEVVTKCKCDYDVAYDTCENTHLLIHMGMDIHCLRNTALFSLFDTAKIQGSALGRLPAVSLSEVLNRCLQVAKGSSIVLHRAGKVSAVLSDNAGGYRVMPQTQLVDISLDKMTRRFGSVSFQSGYVNHEYTTFTVELPDAQEQLSEAYNSIIGHSGRHIELIPGVIFCTSDTGKAAATLRPVFRPEGESYYFSVNTGLRVDHIRSKGSEADGLDKFAAEADLLHTKFDEINEAIEKMAKVTFNYPLNAYIGIAKKIGVPQKYAREGYEDLEHYCGGAPCSVHDLYLSLTRSLAAAERAGVTTLGKLMLEDAIARVFRLHWEDFDLPGSVAWKAAA